MVLKRKLVLLGAAALSLSLLAGCANGSGSADSGKTTITVAIQEVTAMNFDPALNADTTSFQLAPVYDTLIRQMSDGTLEPSLAESWTYESPTSLVLTIRDGVTFSDGSALDAAAVVTNLESVKASGGPYSANFESVSAITAPDAATVQIDLTSPSPTFVNLLATAAGMVASPAAIEAGTLSTEPVGSGPYTLTKSAPGQEYEYSKRDGYWDSEHYPLSGIDIKVVTETQAKLNAVQTGEADIVEYTPDAQIQPLVDSGQIALESAPFNSNFLLLLDRAGTQVPALGDVRVRQAINYALDRAAIADVGGAGSRTATEQLIKPGQSGYVEDLEDTYPYDEAKAKQLLAAAGYADGFTLPMVSISYFDPQAQALAGYLAKIGITLQIENVPLGQYISSITGGEYPSAYFAYNIVDPYADISRLVLPDGTYNPFKVSTDEVQSAYAAAAQSTTPEELDTAMAEVNTVITQDASFAPFLFDRLGYAHTPSLQGVTFDVVRPPAYYDWSFASN